MIKPKFMESSKRYTLQLPQALYDEVQTIATQEQSTVVELLRNFIKLGLVLHELRKEKTKIMMIDKDGNQTELVIAW